MLCKADRSWRCPAICQPTKTHIQEANKLLVWAGTNIVILSPITGISTKCCFYRQILDHVCSKLFKCCWSPTRLLDAWLSLFCEVCLNINPLVWSLGHLANDDPNLAKQIATAPYSQLLFESDEIDSSLVVELPKLLLSFVPTNYCTFFYHVPNTQHCARKMSPSPSSSWSLLMLQFLFLRGVPSACLHIFAYHVDTLTEWTIQTDCTSWLAMIDEIRLSLQIIYI